MISAKNAVFFSFFVFFKKTPTWNAPIASKIGAHVYQQVFDTLPPPDMVQDDPKKIEWPKQLLAHSAQWFKKNFRYPKNFFTKIKFQQN